jgi:hypothetical protein
MLLKLQEEYAKLEAKFRERDEKLAKLNANYRNEAKEIFEICGVDCNGDGFDWDGDDDLLKINFAGKNLDIKRSILTKPTFGGNLFSCLFQKRWDGYHVRDKKGRIYVDLKENWLRPLINYMKYNEDSDSSISPSNYFLRKIVQRFEMDRILDVGETFELNGLDSSALTECSHGETGLKILLDEVFEAGPLQFIKLYSSQVNPLTETPSKVNVRFIPLLYVFKYKSGTTFLVVSTLLQSLPSDNMDTILVKGIQVDKPDQPVFRLREDQTHRDGKYTLRERFPVRFFSTNDETLVLFDLDLHHQPGRPAARFQVKDLQFVEVYEIREINQEIDPVPDEFQWICEDKEGSLSETKEDEEEVSNDGEEEEEETNESDDEDEEDDEEDEENDEDSSPENCDESVCSEKESEEDNDTVEIGKIIERVHGKMGKTSLYYKRKKALYMKRISLLQEEKQFLAEYFSQTWMKEVPSKTARYREMLMDVIHCKSNDGTVEVTEANTSSRGRKRKRKADQTDPIVYFNVEGEVIPILRSTIQRVIPDSQLAVRVSGRWEDQEKDRDEDGNLIVDCHKEAFEQILSALQINSLKENTLEVIVNKLSRNAIEETLNYLLIRPDYITFLE